MSTKQSIVITRAGSVTAVQNPEEYFTGQVRYEPAIPKREGSPMTGGLVSFPAGARTNWHSHPMGQLLIIKEGRGRVQEWGKPPVEVGPGDIVWFPPNVKHWHGATADGAMKHYAIQEDMGQDKGGVVTWMERVTDEQYGC